MSKTIFTCDEVEVESLYPNLLPNCWKLADDELAKLMDEVDKLVKTRPRQFYVLSFALTDKAYPIRGNY